MTNGKIFAQINIGPKNGGVRAKLIPGWARIMVLVGHRALEIWDNRKASVEAISHVYETERNLSQAKRKRSTEDPQEIRQERSSAREAFWTTFSSPAEVEIEEIPIRGGEGTAQRILLYDTIKSPDRVISMCRTREERWMRDPHWSEIRPLPDEKRRQNLHIVFSSTDSPVDIAEKDKNGKIVRSWRFSGPETEIFDYKLVEKVEEEAGETEETFEDTTAERRPLPPTDEELAENLAKAVEKIINSNSEPKRHRKTTEPAKMTENLEAIGVKTRRRRKSS
jgi:hypothetical protein